MAGYQIKRQRANPNYQLPLLGRDLDGKRKRGSYFWVSFFLSFSLTILILRVGFEFFFLSCIHFFIKSVPSKTYSIPFQWATIGGRPPPLWCPLLHRLPAPARSTSKPVPGIKYSAVFVWTPKVLLPFSSQFSV